MRVTATTIALALTLSLCAVGCEDTRSPVEQAVEWFPPSQRATARCIIQAESGGRPDAVSPSNDHGLFQINAVHRRAFEALTHKPFRPTIYEPILNGQMARKVWDDAGGSWRPWTTRSACGAS